MHRLLFLDPARRATQQKSLAAVRPATNLHFHIFANLAPISLIGHLFGKAAYLRPWCADHITALCGVEPGNVLSAHHAAVHHPYPVHLTKALLHTLYDLFYGANI